MKRILVTGAGGAPGINFIESLKLAPEEIEIVAADSNAYHLQWLGVKARYLVPNCTDPDYIDILNAIIEREGVEFVHPQPDVEVKALSDERARIKARTFFPAAETISILQDKKLSAERWKAAGIYTSPSIEIRTRDDIRTAAEQICLPFWMRATTGAGAKGSTLVENLDTAWHWLQYWRSRNCDWTFIAQEYLPGRDYAFQSIWKDGELVSSQARERLEYIYPHLAPSGRTGTPIVAVTVDNDELNDISIRCVKAIDPNATGIFCVDLREDASGRPIPTEINAGRFFTTSLFYTKAGVNMPYMYVKMAYGEPIPETKPLNAVGAGLHWIRHVDCPAVLLREEQFEHHDFSKLK